MADPFLNPNASVDEIIKPAAPAADTAVPYTGDPFLNPNAKLTDIHEIFGQEFTPSITDVTPQPPIPQKPVEQSPILWGLGGIGVGAITEKAAEAYKPETKPLSSTKLEEDIAVKQKELETAQGKHSNEIEKHAGKIELLNKTLEEAQALHEESLTKINDIKDRADKLGINLQPVEKVPPKPAGGPGTAKYGKNLLGLTETEAAQAVDMTKKPGGAWDIASKVKAAKEKVSRLAPGWASVEERGDLMLPMGFEKSEAEKEAARLIKEWEDAHASAEQTRKQVANAQLKFDKANDNPPKNLSKAEERVQKLQEELDKFNTRYGYRAKASSEIPTGSEKFLKAIMPGPKIAGGLAGLQSAEAINALKRGDYKNAALSGLSSLGGALQLGSNFMPPPYSAPVRGVGALLQYGPTGYQLLEEANPTSTIINATKKDINNLSRP
jgi:hypothetical protein